MSILWWRRGDWRCTRKRPRRKMYAIACSFQSYLMYLYRQIKHHRRERTGASFPWRSKSGISYCGKRNGLHQSLQIRIRFWAPSLHLTFTHLARPFCRKTASGAALRTNTGPTAMIQFSFCTTRTKRKPLTRVAQSYSIPKDSAQLCKSVYPSRCFLTILDQNLHLLPTRVDPSS